jgi:tetratricopeptide (TPR) repeat protein/tRNA A-37 threonylcarbamoyl transferase component Bud32
MAATHQDLLFGLLALQNGLIDQDQLLAAFRARTRDRGRDLAGHLEALGHLADDDRAAVEAMVALHLKRSGGDVERSLASLPVGRSTRERLESCGDPELTRSLGGHGRRSTEVGGNDDEVGTNPDRTATSAVGTATSGGQRFRVLRPHARGGLGAVFVAMDGELNREVALKQILEHHADDPVSRTRFLLEAEITGGLEHPGIVPVYGLGAHDDGRPYYAMRFVRGDSLKEAIEQFHKDEALKSHPGRRALELRKLLRRFLDVCNAIEYAHSRGVLHRDIKPGNVIVGRHGETLVVDWGLAKPTGKAEYGDGERTLRPASSSGSAETLLGAALGTPAYMSPEQARGDLDALGPRSDVYSLGATLYSLLTGRPPFEGQDVGAVLRAVQKGEFPAPRELDRTIPGALEAVCLKAMATEPEARYATAAALADDLEHWLADEPVAAYRREPLGERVGRWSRRHRGWVQAGVAGLVVVAVVAVAAAFQIDAARRAAEEAQLQASRNEIEARRNLEVATRNLRLAQDVVRDSFHKIAGSTLAEIPQGGPLRRELARIALDYNDRFLEIDPKNRDVRWDVADINQTVGRLFAGANQPETAMAHLTRARDLMRALVTESDGLLPHYRWEYRDMLGRICLEASIALRNRGRFDDARPYIEEGLAAIAEGRQFQDRALDELRASKRPHDDALKREVNFYEKAAQESETIGVMLESEAARIALDEGRFADALPLYDRVAAHFVPRIDALDPRALRDAIRNDPGGAEKKNLSYVGWGFRGRGLALLGLGRGDEARRALDEGIRYLELAEAEAIDVRFTLGEILLARALAADDADGRRAVLDRLVELAGRLVEESPEVRPYPLLLARALAARGDHRTEAGEADPAAEDFRAALEHVEPLLLVEEGRPAADDRVVAAESLAGLGRLALARGDAEAARPLLERAASLLDEALAVCPRHVRGLAARERLRETTTPSA